MPSGTAKVPSFYCLRRSAPLKISGGRNNGVGTPLRDRSGKRIVHQCSGLSRKDHGEPGAGYGEREQARSWAPLPGQLSVRTQILA